MTGEKIAKSIKSMKVAPTVNSNSIENARFHLYLASDVYMTYDSLLFSIYSKIKLFLIWIADSSKLRVLGKNNIFLKVMIDSEALRINFLNVLHSPDLEYNLFSISIIDQAGYSVLAKNRKMPVFDNEDNIALVGTKIWTCYLIDITFGETYQALFFCSSSQNPALWTE